MPRLVRCRGLFGIAEGIITDSIELLVIVLAVSCVAMTFYLRKNLERHGFNLWVYAGVPIFALAIVAFVLWQEELNSFYESLFFALATLALGVEFLGTLLATMKRRG